MRIWGKLSDLARINSEVTIRENTRIQEFAQRAEFDR